MPRKESEAVPEEGNGPILQQEEFGSGQPTMEGVYRMTKEAFDRWDRKLDEISDSPLLAQQLKSDECLYWGGITFTTARPFVPTMCFVRKRFSQEIT